MNVKGFFKSDAEERVVDDLEEGLLGTILSNNCPELVLDVVDPSCFYSVRRQRIFSAILDVHTYNGELNSLTVSQQLAQNGDSEAAYLTELSLKGDSHTSAHVEFLARKVAENAARRKTWEIGLQIAETARAGGDAFEIIDNGQNDLADIANRNARLGKPVTLKEVLGELLDEIDLLKSGAIKCVGTSTGITKLDKWTGGLEPGSLYTLAGRPGQGKSAIAAMMFSYIGEKKPAAFFALEMTKKETVRRLLSAASGISYYHLKNGTISDHEGHSLTEGAGTLAAGKCFIDDRPNLSLNELRAKVKRLTSEHGIVGIFVDYLQLMRMPKADTRDQAIGEVTRGLKSMAKEFEIFVVLLSQLNRQVEARADKRPVLSDLRESGNIEQDSDVVMFVHRPETYGIERLENGRSSKGVAFLELAKQRNGVTGTIELEFVGEQITFRNPAPEIPIPKEPWYVDN